MMRCNVFLLYAVHTWQQKQILVLLPSALSNSIPVHFDEKLRRLISEAVSNCLSTFSFFMQRRALVFFPRKKTKWTESKIFFIYIYVCHFSQCPNDDHSGPPCQNVCDHFPSVIVRQHNFIQRSRGEFQRSYNLQIFDSLQLNFLQTKHFIRINK